MEADFYKRYYNMLSISKIGYLFYPTFTYIHPKYLPLIHSFTIISLARTSIYTALVDFCNNYQRK